MTLPVRWGLTADYAYPGADSVEVTFRFRGPRLWRRLISGEAIPSSRVLWLGWFRCQLDLLGDLFAGTIRWTIQIDQRTRLGGPWAPWRTWGDSSVITFDPSVTIGGQTSVHPPMVVDPVYGDSQNCTGTILRLHIDDEPRKLCAVGNRVNSGCSHPRIHPSCSTWWPAWERSSGAG